MQSGQAPDTRKQLVITERSVPEHIAGWLNHGSREVALVAAEVATDAVKNCVELVHKHDLPIIFQDEKVGDVLTPQLKLFR